MSTFLNIRRGCVYFPYDDGKTPQRYLLLNPEGRQFVVSQTTKELLEALESSRSLEAICDELSAAGNLISPQQLEAIVRERYQHLGVFGATGPSAQASLKIGKWPFLQFGTLISARIVAGVSSHLTWLYSRLAILVFGAAVLATHIALYWPGTHHVPLFKHGYAVIAIALSLSSIIFHEFGHSTALSRFGTQPGGIGFGLYVLLPTFYADVSGVWRLPRRQRYVVDLGGVFFQQIAFVLLALVALATSSSECLGVCISIDSMCLLALNPAFRFDGYWLLADWLGMSQLHKRANSELKEQGRRLLRRSGFKGAGSIERLSGIKAVTFGAYMVLCNVFSFAMLLYGWTFLKHLVIVLFQDFPGQMSAIEVSAKAKAWGTVFDHVSFVCITFLFLATATAGILLYLFRSGRLLLNYFRRYLVNRRRPRADENSTDALAAG